MRNTPTNRADDCRATVATGFPRSTDALIDVTVGGASHTGLVRTNNEDHFVAIRRTRSRQILATNIDVGGLNLASQHAYVLIVADGVGGHKYGELASELVLRSGWEVAGRDPNWIMKFDKSQWSWICQQVDIYAREIQKTLHEQAVSHPECGRMATTWTCACLLDAEAVIAYAGDSRAYLFRKGAIRQLTRDQTLAQEMQDRGMPAKQAARFQNTLTNAFGGDEEEVFVEVKHVSLMDGDRLLLCTDGLTNLVSDAEIASKLAASPAPQAVCDQLIDLALLHGGTDNITAVVAEFHSTPAAGTADRPGIDKIELP